MRLLKSQVIQLLLLVLVLHVAFLGVFSSLTNRGVLATNENKMQQLAGTTVDYLVLGDSHGQQLNDTLAEDGSFVNLSANGTNYAHHYYALRYAIEHDITVKNVIIPLDPNSFARWKHRFFLRNQHYWVDVLDYNDLDSQGIMYEGGYINFRQEYLHYKVAPYLFNTDTWLLVADTLFGTKGPEVATAGLQEQLDRAFYDDPILKNYFYRMMDYAEQNDINVILLTYPASSEYLAAYTDLEGHYDNTRKEIEAKGFSPQWIDIRSAFRDEQFKDGHHLFREYHNQLTQIVLERIVQVPEQDSV